MTENAPMNLAQQIAAVPPSKTTRKGPPPVCEIYGPGDLEVLAVIQQRKTDYQESWADIQRLVDEVLGIERPIRNDKFRYHFTQKCGHWS
jgi:hypothetical protein